MLHSDCVLKLKICEAGAEMCNEVRSLAENWCEFEILYLVGYQNKNKKYRNEIRSSSTVICTKDDIFDGKLKLATKYFNKYF